MYVRECISEIAAGLVCGKSGCAGVRMWTGFGNRLFAPDACIIHSKKNNCKLNQSKNSTNKQFLERKSVINMQNYEWPGLFEWEKWDARRRKRPQTRLTCADAFEEKTGLRRGKSLQSCLTCADAFEEKTGLSQAEKAADPSHLSDTFGEKIHTEKYLLSIKKAYNCVCCRLWLEMFMSEMKNIHLSRRGQRFFSSFTGEEF